MKKLMIVGVLALTGCNPYSDTQGEVAQLRIKTDDQAQQITALTARVDKLTESLASTDAQVATANSTAAEAMSRPDPTARPERQWVLWKVPAKRLGTPAGMGVAFKDPSPQPVDSVPSRELCLKAARSYVSGDDNGDSQMFIADGFIWRMTCLPEGTQPRS